MLKRILVVLVVITLVFSLVACNNTQGEKPSGGNGVEEPGKEGRKLSQLVAGTSSSTGTYYLYGGNWSKVINSKVEGVDITCEVSGGPTKNLQLMENDEIDLGFVTAWMAGEAFSGIGEFEGDKSTNSRAMFPMYTSVMYIFTVEGRGIETIQDLEGKNVGTGSPGGTSDKAARRVLEVLNVKPREVSALSSDVAANAISDGLVDAAFYVGSVPASYMMNLETTNKLKFIELKDEEFEKIFNNYPFWAKDIMPANTYKNQDVDIELISFWNYAIAHKDLDEDLVYDLVKETFENNNLFIETDKNFKTTIVEYIDKIVTPLHKGAYKYYKELNIEIPEGIVPSD